MVRAALPPDWRCARFSQSSHDGRVNASCSRNPTGCSGLSEGRLTHPPRPPAQCQGPHVAFRSGSSPQPHGHRWAWHAHPRVLADGGGGQHSRSSAQRPSRALPKGPRLLGPPGSGNDLAAELRLRGPRASPRPRHVRPCHLRAFRGACTYIF